VNTFIDTLKGLGATRLAAMGAVAVGLIAFFIYVTTQMTGDPMALLYNDLSQKDKNRIIAELQKQGVQYTVAGGGSQIRVPKERVGQLRLQMAEQGLPGDSSIGYEIFDNTSGLGTTNFVQNVNRLRAMEGELARTIRSIDNVAQARVHLVLPQRELFSRERQESSASIALLMEGNARLNEEQILAVQHLVASAVAEMEPNMVSIVDQQGTLLARGSDDQNPFGGPLNPQEVRVNAEQRLRQSLEQLIERSVGPGNVRAEVSVDMNFDRITENTESFDPNSQVARSEQTVEETETELDGGEDGRVTVEQNLPAEQANQDGGAQSRSERTREEETTNYELSRTTTTRVRQGSEIDRLSVAVLVDGKYTTNEAGEEVYQERTQQELQQIAALARSAVGFSEQRGDQLEVINLQFADPTEGLKPAEPNRFLGMRSEQLMRAAELIVLGIVAVLILLLVVRPLLSRLLEQPAGEAGQGLLGDQAQGQAQLAAPGAETAQVTEFGMEEEEEGEQLIDLNRVEGRVRASSVRKIGEIVEQHPEEAVSIIRSWIYQQQG
jgi:flagellar M-ring protein FliF